MNIAVVVGAGFSKATNSVFPITDELGNAVKGQLLTSNMPDIPDFSDGYFEGWLSRIAEPQPDLNDVENARNNYLFSAVTDAIYSVMIECQFQAFQSDPPDWLTRLVMCLHYAEGTVITFNYDTVVEKALDYIHPQTWHQFQGRADSETAVGNLPPRLPREGMWAKTSATTFRLLKLHGSLEFYWVPGDISGSTIAHWRHGTGWAQAARYDDFQRRSELPGRSPFLVPPASSKSSFYANPITREMWQRAAKSLREADLVYLMGYSIPLTDLVTNGMLRDSLAHTSSKVVVADKFPEGVLKRLHALGVAQDRITSFDGGGSVGFAVAHLENALGMQVLMNRADFQQSDRLVVAAPRGETFVCEDVRIEGNCVVVNAGDFTGPVARSGGDPPSGPTGRDLARLAERAVGIECAFRTGKRAPIIGARFLTSAPMTEGAGHVLVTSDAPPLPH